MSANAISVTIDEIVLRGTGHLDRRAFRLALTEELTRLLGRGIAVPDRITLEAVAAPAVQLDVQRVTAEVDADALGRQLAASIAGVLTVTRSVQVYG